MFAQGVEAPEAEQAPAPPTAKPAPRSAGALPPVEAAPAERPVARASLEERVEAWTAGRTDTRGQPCVYFDAVQTPLGVAVACGPGGLWLLREAGTGFELEEVRDLGGQVVGFLLDGDNLWVKLSRVEAVPFDPAVGLSDTRVQSARTSTPRRPDVREAQNPYPEPDAPRAARARGSEEGRVVSLAEGYAIVTLGADHGIEPGSSIEFLVEEQLPVPGGTRAINRKDLAVGVVTRVSSEHAEVRLGLNERVPVGAIARLSNKRPTESRAGPPRLSRIWEVGGVVRPFLGLNELGGGVLFSAFGSYRFDSSFRLFGALDPVGWGNSDEERAVSTATGFVAAAFDSRLFEIGFGLGAQTMNSVDTGLATGSASLLVQTLRLGSHDGLHIAARSDISLFHSEFAFSGLTITGQLPVGRGIWLTLRGAGSSAGYGQGELGIRTLLSGNGDRGSSFLYVGLGGAQLHRDTACEVRNGRCENLVSSTRVSGPMGAFGMEWRF